MLSLLPCPGTLVSTTRALYSVVPAVCEGTRSKYQSRREGVGQVAVGTGSQSGDILLRGSCMPAS